MTRADRIALVISLIAVLVTYYVTLRYFEGIPHLEDEIAYVWQARAIAEGKLTVASPPQSESFLVPFVVDHNGQRFFDHHVAVAQEILRPDGDQVRVSGARAHQVNDSVLVFGRRHDRIPAAITRACSECVPVLLRSARRPWT